MIRYKSYNQQKIEMFSTPFEMNMNPNNRWVKLSKSIPWDELASIYYQAMNSQKGAPSIDARIVIGALIIKHMLRLDDRGTIEMISENVYMQYFLGLSAYTDESVFDPSLFVSIRKRLGLEAFNQMNERIINKALGLTLPKATVQKESENQSGSDTLQNKGKLQIDATVADADIKYPTDVDLLNDSRMKSEEIVDLLYAVLKPKIKPRTYRRKARKEYLTFAKNKNKSKQQIRKSVKSQLGYLGRNLKTIEKMLNDVNPSDFPLNKKLQKYLFVIQEVYRQQLAMYKGSTHQISDRIVNIHQPHVRPIVRGKSGKPVEFGAKIDVSLQGGFSNIERLSWDAFNEGQDLKFIIEKYKQEKHYYPALIQVDKIYLNRENRKYLKEKGIRYTGKPLGRPPMEEMSAYEKRKAKKEAAERNQVEGYFGLSKRKYRLNRIYAKTRKTAESWIAAIIMVTNIMKILRDFLLSFFSTENFYTFLLLRRKLPMNLKNYYLIAV
jgi:hypothetical protein